MPSRILDSDEDTDAAPIASTLAPRPASSTISRPKIVDERMKHLDEDEDDLPLTQLSQTTANSMHKGPPLKTSTKIHEAKPIPENASSDLPTIQQTLHPIPTDANGNTVAPTKVKKEQRPLSTGSKRAGSDLDDDDDLPIFMVLPIYITLSSIQTSSCRAAQKGKEEDGIKESL